MKKILLTIISILLIVIFTSVNISAGSRYDIVGDWSPPGLDYKITFTDTGEILSPYINGTYEYNGERLIFNFKRGYKYRTITTVNAFIENDKIYMAYPSKGYLMGSKHNEGLTGDWESYRMFTLTNDKTGYPIEERYDYMRLRFWDGYLSVRQSYDTYEEKYNSFSYKTAYDEVVGKDYIYSIKHPSYRIYYEIVELEEVKLLLLSFKYELNGDETESVVFNYPYYEKLK